jgi:sporulation protein YlmC with PRC-barrel domain
MNRAIIIGCALATTIGLAQAQTTPGNQNQSAQSPSVQSPSVMQPGKTPGQNASPTAQHANPAAANQANQLTFYTVKPEHMRVSELVGATVYNLKNEEIGDVEDLLIDNSHTVRGVVISVGGFLGIGERNIAIDPSSLRLAEDSDGSVRVTLNTNKDELKKAPQVSDAELNRSATTVGSGQPRKR